MRAQFDPDIWAALLIIVAVGFGGVLFLDLLVNAMDMHSILSIFDKEISLKGLYIMSALTRDDFGVYNNRGGNANFSSLENFYTTKDYTVYHKYTNETIKLANSVSWDVKLPNGEDANHVCGFIAPENKFDKYYDNCKKRYNMVYQYQIYVYSSVGPAIAFFALEQPKKQY